jgi:hypothetical protein
VAKISDDYEEYPEEGLYHDVDISDPLGFAWR